MIDVAGNNHYLAHQPADSDASLCLPPSYISGDCFVNPATGCFTPRVQSIHLLRVTSFHAFGPCRRGCVLSNRESKKKKV